MSEPVLTDTLPSRIRDLERRLGVLERRGPATALGAGVLIPASQITGLLPASQISGLTWSSTTGQGGTQQSLVGLELYHPSSTPHIDFHRAASSAGDSGADYNVRLMNDAAGQLTLYGGGLYAVNGWVASEGDFRSGLATMRTHPIHAGYALFGHTSMLGSTQYGFLQNTAETIVNGPVVYLSNNGTWRLSVGADVSINVRLNVTGGVKIHSDWVRVAGNNGIHWDNHGVGWWTDDSAWIKSYNGRGIFTTGEIRANNCLNTPASDGSTGLYLWHRDDANHRLYYHSPINGPRLSGWGGCGMVAPAHDHMCVVQAQTRHVNNANSAWRYSDAAGHTNMSDPRNKKDMAPLRATLGLQRQKLKEITPIKYKLRPERADTEGDRDHLGFNGDELPEEVIHLREMPDGRIDKMFNPAGVLAILWQIVAEIDAAAELVEARLAAIESLPIVGLNHPGPR